MFQRRTNRIVGQNYSKLFRQLAYLPKQIELKVKNKNCYLEIAPLLMFGRIQSKPLLTRPAPKISEKLN